MRSTLHLQQAYPIGALTDERAAGGDRDREIPPGLTIACERCGASVRIAGVMYSGNYGVIVGFDGKSLSGHYITDEPGLYGDPGQDGHVSCADR